MDKPANDPPPPRTWLFVAIELSGGAVVELRLPGAVAASISVYAPEPGEEPSLTVERAGQRRRGLLARFFGAGA